MKSQVGAAVAVLALSSTLLAPSSPASATDRAAAPRAFAANGRIAFTEPDPRKPTYVAAPQVWTAGPDGSGAQRAFAAIEEDNAYPEWSPDGRWIAFYRGHTLMVARADGSEARVVAPGAGIIGAVTSWSPDGTRIAYSVGSNPVRGEIWVVNADGTDAHLIHSGYGAEGPSWSPDGTTIAFAQKPPDDASGNTSFRDRAVYLMDVDGGNVRRITGDEGGSLAAFVEDYAPNWSPDGSRIAFVSARDVIDPMCLNCSRYDIYTMRPDGTDVVRYPKEGNELRPVWSPDGASLAYTAMPTPPFNPKTNPIQVDVLDLTTLATHHVAPVAMDGAADWGPVPGSMPTADLTASVVADTAFAPLGGVVRYTATLRNSGTSPASDAAVEIRLPTGATYDAATPGCTGASVVTCAAGALGVGENRSFTIGASAAAPGAFDVSALAVSTTVDPQTANNRATVPVTVCTALGGTGRDRLVGTPGNDVLCGAGGNDTLHGQGGDDVLLGGPGNDKLDGGPGKDTATYAEATGKVKASLARGSATGDGKDRFKRVENLMGSRYADRLVGSGAGNVLSGLGGRDRIDARAGRDVIVAGDGDDRIAPGGGGDRVQGGLGVDVLDYRASARGVSVDLIRQKARAEGVDGLRSVEGVLGSRFADHLEGSPVGNRLIGGPGDDRLTAAGGNDRISGGLGADRLAGGDGDDRLLGGAGVDRCAQDFGRGRNRQCERS